ncbi:threonine ammonia-lyase [Paenibacillus sp. y28]|uniref:threonine ammonia-lyase n=1 Tax=Paenibacillus sp. y28 TaxID=3129110 RepID=UPI0030173E5E
MTLEQVLRARFRLSGHIHRTPLQLCRSLSEMTGCNLYTKLENLQKTGAFKIRGAFNKVADLMQQGPVRGIVTASAGNHAQGVAFAARHFGIPATVVMHESASSAKVRATESYGSRVLLHGCNYDEAYEEARRLAAADGLRFVHAFDDAAVISGQGTIGLELLEDLPEVDTVVVPVGGGGLISGIATALKSLKPSVRIIGVQPEGASSGVSSWRSGSRVSIEKPGSIADGLAVKTPGELPLACMLELVDDMVTVSEEQILSAMAVLLERTKMLAEGAGAAALAAVLNEKAVCGTNTAVIVSGGNIDLMKLPLLSQTMAAISL